MYKRIVITAAIFGIFAVVFGAFAAHGLKSKISALELVTWRTAVEYQFYHVFALLFLGSIARTGDKLINWSYWFFTIGIILFSGSLYLIAAKNLLSLNEISVIGPLTPVGGLFFIAGWFCLLFSTFKNTNAGIK